MDIHNAISYVITNQNTLRADINKIIVGGHSLGGLTTLFYTYVNKEEIENSFNSNFYTDNRFLDLSIYRNKLKMAFASGGGITNLDYINNDENTPLFLVHGTHDGASPFYTGSQLCSKIFEAPSLYGSAAIAEKLDSFPDNLDFSYYFVQLNGIGHNTFFESDNFSNTFVSKLWKPDFYRFLINNLYPFGGSSPKNQFYKIVSPNNTIYNYCELYQNKGRRELPISYFHANKAAQDSSELNACGTPMTACLSIPNLNLTTKVWTDNYINLCQSFYPPINFNTFSNDTCIKPISDTFNITIPNELLGLYQLIYGSNAPTSIISILNGNYNFMRKAKSNDKNNLSNISFKIYPNPTSHFLNIENTKNVYIKNINIYNDLGSLVMSKSYNISDEIITYFNIPVASLSNGTYFVKLESINNQIFTSKFIIQK